MDRVDREIEALAKFKLTKESNLAEQMAETEKEIYDALKTAKALFGDDPNASQYAAGLLKEAGTLDAFNAEVKYLQAAKAGNVPIATYFRDAKASNPNATLRDYAKAYVQANTAYPDYSQLGAKSQGSGLLSFFGVDRDIGAEASARADRRAQSLGLTPDRSMADMELPSATYDRFEIEKRRLDPKVIDTRRNDALKVVNNLLQQDELYKNSVIVTPGMYGDPIGDIKVKPGVTDDVKDQLAIKFGNAVNQYFNAYSDVQDPMQRYILDEAKKQIYTFYNLSPQETKPIDKIPVSDVDKSITTETGDGVTSTSPRLTEEGGVPFPRPKPTYANYSPESTPEAIKTIVDDPNLAIQNPNTAATFLNKVMEEFRGFESAKDIQRAVEKLDVNAFLAIAEATNMSGAKVDRVLQAYEAGRPDGIKSTQNILKNAEESIKREGPDFDREVLLNRLRDVVDDAGKTGMMGFRPQTKEQRQKVLANSLMTKLMNEANPSERQKLINEIKEVLANLGKPKKLGFVPRSDKKRQEDLSKSIFSRAGVGN